MWKTALFGEIDDMIVTAELQMNPSVKYFWDKICIVPQKWQLSPWGDMGGGFWVVAVIGQWCLYYNDIEEGFNGSNFSEFGKIEQYSCGQLDLISCIALRYHEFKEAICRDF